MAVEAEVAVEPAVVAVEGAEDSVVVVTVAEVEAETLVEEDTAAEMEAEVRVVTEAPVRPAADRVVRRIEVMEQRHLRRTDRGAAREVTRRVLAAMLLADRILTCDQALGRV